MARHIGLRFRVIFALLLLILLPPEVLAGKRVALVIGNGAYQHSETLANPTRDAKAMAELLRSAGFDSVLAFNDVGNLEFKRSLRHFLDLVHDSDIAVLFYAGHGIQIGDQNYMVPVDAKLAREYDAKDEAISLERLVEALEPATRLRLVILDACRDNPFLVRMQRRVASRGAVTRGLARVEPTQVDTLIAYAARAGSTAADGDDDNSPFTKALLKHIAEPGLDIRLAFGRVRDDVLKNTRSEQEPFVYGSLGGSNISLVPPPAVPKEPPLADVAGDYNLVEKINTRMAWEVFINTHRTGILVDLARKRLQMLEEQDRQNAEREATLAKVAQEKTDADRKKAEQIAMLAEAEAERKRRAEEDRQKAEREAALATAAREKAEAERKKAERDAAIAKAAEAEAGRKRRAEGDRQKEKREAALARADRAEA